MDMARDKEDQAWDEEEDKESWDEESQDGFEQRCLNGVL